MRSVFLDIYEKYLFYFIGPVYRKTGQRLAGLGLNIQGPLANDDRCKIKSSHVFHFYFF